ncbi:SRPBCC family protein [Mycolicibacterium mengxianglii]|uniref:SRPBCC family protein n=1 Tax=Mycolicibacterium mengxianglii TaxID=2736649 RepID=UPI0018D18129|nr:SRPBCC family protein [Mycolicibacterium mengxianglii]
MARWFPLEPSDASVFDSAAHVFRYRKRFDAPPEVVWASLASDHSLADWGPSVQEVTWSTPRPFGIGTRREVAITLGLARVREEFFRWDEGRGCSFYVYEANAPLFRRFAEDYRISPDGSGTLFEWTVAIEPRRALRLPFRALAPVLKAGFGRMAADGEKYFADR